MLYRFLPYREPQVTYSKMLKEYANLFWDQKYMMRMNLSFMVNLNHLYFFSHKDDICLTKNKVAYYWDSYK